MSQIVIGYNIIILSIGSSLGSFELCSNDLTYAYYLYEPF